MSPQSFFVMQGAFPITNLVNPPQTYLLHHRGVLRHAASTAVSPSALAVAPHGQNTTPLPFFLNDSRCPKSVDQTSRCLTASIMHDMGELLKTLTLTSMALGSGRPSFAFVPPPPLRDLQWTRSQAVPLAKEEEGRRWSGLPFLPRYRRPQQQAPRQQSRAAPPRWSSSSAASSDAAREEEPWPGELGSEAPFFPPFVNQQRAAAGPTAASLRQGEEREREAFTFAPKPLPEGRVLRRMKEADIDGVLDL